MKKYIILAVFLAIGTGLIAQTTDPAKKASPTDSLLNSLGGETKDAPVAIFKASRFILSQTTETIKKKNLNFLIIHRFGDFAGSQGGGQTYFGLDDVADVYLGFEYGVTDNLNVDIGRTTIGGLADLEVKYALLHQTTSGSSPLAITVIGETGVRPYGQYDAFPDRVSYFAQALFARKFSPGFSLQLAPSFVRNNEALPFVVGSELSFVSLSATARFKITNHMGFLIDYAHPFSSFRNGNGFSDPLGFGIEIETGGHVFTINVTNAKAISEINYLSNTTSSYSRGQYRVGFTISRIFDFNHKKGDEQK